MFIFRTSRTADITKGITRAKIQKDMAELGYEPIFRTYPNDLYLFIGAKKNGETILDDEPELIGAAIKNHFPLCQYLDSIKNRYIKGRLI